MNIQLTESVLKKLYAELSPQQQLEAIAELELSKDQEFEVVLRGSVKRGVTSCEVSVMDAINKEVVMIAGQPPIEVRVLNSERQLVPIPAERLATIGELIINSIDVG